MSIDVGYLTLLLDAPLQSWGFDSRFQRRATGMHPTKSGVIGLICAAMGLEKGSIEERQTLPKLAALKMTTITIPRRRINPWSKDVNEVPMRRLEDFHTVGGGYDKKMERFNIPRKASGGPCDNPTVTHRQYLLDACFGVMLSGEETLLERVAEKLQDPVWGIWFGRKSCIPAQPVYRGLFATDAEAYRALIGDTPLESYMVVREVEGFAAGTDSLNDQPLSFGDGKTSGVDTRRFAPRRIEVRPAIRGR